MTNAYKKWTMRNGKEILVKDMTTQHIKNTINCLESGRITWYVNAGWAQDNDYQEMIEVDSIKYKWLEVFKKELERRIRMTNAEAQKIINMEHDIDILEQDYSEFIKANNLSDNFHNAVVWLSTKGVLKVKND